MIVCVSFNDYLSFLLSTKRINYSVRKKEFYPSRSSSSTDKCRNCKARRHDLSSNPGPIVFEFNFRGLSLQLRQKK